jgi:hypothetical protein
MEGFAARVNLPERYGFRYVGRDPGVFKAVD